LPAALGQIIEDWPAESALLRPMTAMFTAPPFLAQTAGVRGGNVLTGGVGRKTAALVGAALAGSEDRAVTFL
jgi:hypothetical protein